VGHLGFANPNPKKWNLPGKQPGVNAVVVTKCDNCGEKDHLANKCPKPRDDELCKKACDARAKAKENSGGRGGRGAGGRGNSDERAPWKKSEGSNSGVNMIDGAWKMLCNKGCGWNTSHTTGYHNEQSRSIASFKVPPDHPYWLLSGKAWAAAGAAVTLPSGADATQIIQDRQQLTAMTGVVDRYMTGTDNAEMSSFLLPWRFEKCTGKLAGHSVLDWSFYALILLFPVILFILYLLFGSYVQSWLYSLVSAGQPPV